MDGRSGRMVPQYRLSSSSTTRISFIFELNSVESKVAFVRDRLTFLSILDQLLWKMYRMISLTPPLIVSNPIVDRFGPINLDHLLLANVPRQELIVEQRRNRHPFHRPLLIVLRRFSSSLTDRQCHPR